LFEKKKKGKKMEKRLKMGLKLNSKGIERDLNVSNGTG
jgi:hypothetical protein